MARIIITVCDKRTGTTFDTEVPNDLEIDKLKDDLIQALMGANPNLSWDLYSVELNSPKHGRILRSNRTLKEEGIWNGDYLFLVER